MALKDWKKIKENEFRKSKSRIYIVKEDKHTFTINIIDKISFTKWVKTKQQALKFAKSYMRKN